MAYQIRGFMLRLATEVNVYQLLALSLALGAVIMIPGGGGGSGA
jgi:hypothetical protein